MAKSPNLQDVFLASARSGEIPVTVFLINGFQMRGVITGFDAFGADGGGQAESHLQARHLHRQPHPERGFTGVGGDLSLACPAPHGDYI